jgi:di/tricarboxylate transporter
LFKERLRKTGKTILEQIIIPVTIWITGVILVATILIKTPTFMIVASLIALTVIIMILLIALCVFIHWLFIEPFKKGE